MDIEHGKYVFIYSLLSTESSEFSCLIGFRKYFLSDLRELFFFISSITIWLSRVEYNILMVNTDHLISRKLYLNLCWKWAVHSQVSWSWRIHILLTVFLWELFWCVESYSCWKRRLSGDCPGWRRWEGDVAGNKNWSFVSHCYSTLSCIIPPLQHTPGWEQDTCYWAWLIQILAQFTNSTIQMTGNLFNPQFKY